MSPKKAHAAKPPHVPVWTLTYKKDGSLDANPILPAFSQSKLVEIVFVNDSGKPAILGIVATGRFETDGNVNDDQKCIWIPNGGERDTGLAPLNDNTPKPIPPFKVTGEIPGQNDFWEFVYSVFVVDGSNLRNYKRLRYKVMGKSFDPHVIITS
jgi:hypothetical protein